MSTADLDRITASVPQATAADIIQLGHGRAALLAPEDGKASEGA